MCGTCGCSPEHGRHHGVAHEALHALGIEHHHHPDDGHERQRLPVEQDILAGNDRTAERNRGYFEAKGIYCVNLVSSPGSGKTALLEATLRKLRDRFPIAVIEGDQQTSRDADRIAALGVKGLQINTENGCHLDARMVRDAVRSLDPEPGTLLFVENVGNLVCPALFDLGETDRAVMISVTEGEDKPLKYPYMFESATLCIINKTDLLPYLDFNLEQLRENARTVNPHLRFFELSATRGTGMETWCDFLVGKREEAVR